ncbi:MAG: hypothetical protein KDA89_25630 [Planctomycetaceae bacterium]|nr:hypothetical protein [Planctomycetaceae bacterium]
MAKNKLAKKNNKQGQKEFEQHQSMLMKLIQKQEPVHPDLAGYVKAGGIGCGMVHHPLIVSPIYVKDCYGYVNYLYEQRNADVQRLMDAEEWKEYVFTHERPYQLDAFSRIAKRMSDTTYWSILGSVYTESENLWQQKPKLVCLLTVDRKQREFLMNGRERGYLKELPSTLTIYRGYQYRNANGWSWTLDPKKAHWFAHRFKGLGGKPTVATGRVKKRDVVAYFSRRQEKEIVVDPSAVKVTKRETQKL